MKTQISLFLPSKWVGGAEQVFADLAIGFLQQGFSVDIVLRDASGPILEKLPPAINVFQLGFSRMIYSLIPLCNYIVDKKPKAIISALEIPNSLAVFAGIISGRKTKVIISIHNVNSQFPRNSLKQKFELFFHKSMYRRADKIICVSNGVANDAIKLYSLPPHKIQVIYNPVNIGQIRKLARAPINTQDLKLMAFFDGPVILGVGRLSLQKDFSTLIRAFRRVRDQMPAKLIILGEGEERGELEQLISQLDLESDCMLPGYVKNPYKYILRADVFVLSSKWEGCPLVLVEAMALNRPIISTSCPGGSKELLDSGRHGKLVGVGDVEGMAQMIIEQLQITEDITVPSEWLHQFSINHVVKKYIEAIQT